MRSREPATPIGARDGCFVGRRPELLCLERVLEAAREGSGGVALLVGEAGIGKTRLAEELARRARRQGVGVLWGRCHEGEQCPSFGPWAEALGIHVRSVDAETLRQEMGEGAVDIAAIVPEVRRTLQRIPLADKLRAEDGEHRLFASLALFLRACARREPLALILDNLHLADAASHKLLRRLAPELENSRLLVVGTCRASGEALGVELALTVEQLGKARGFCRLDLQGLGKEDVRDYLARALSSGSSSALADAIHARTEGNPLFMVELVRQMIARPCSEGVEPPLPEGLRQAIGRRLEGLPRRSQEVLAAAAVLGRSFDAEVLGRTLDDGANGELDRTLEGAVFAEVLQAEEPAPGGYRFVHALVQETLLDGVPEAEKARLHARAARVLEQTEDADPHRRSVEILRHLIGSGSLAEPRHLVERTLRAVDEAVDRYAPDEALRIIESTLAAWERQRLVIDARLAALFQRRGRAYTDLQRPMEARESLVRAFDLYAEAGDERGAVDVALTPAYERAGPATWLTSVGGGGRGVSELRERALAWLSADSPERAALLIHRGSRADLREALALARRSADRRLEGASLTQLAVHELVAWELGDCAEYLVAAEGMANRGNDYGNAFGCTYVRYYLGLITGDAPWASAATQDLFDLAQRSRSRRVLTAAYRCSASLASKRGDWEDARRQAEQALGLLAGSGPVLNHVMSLEILLEGNLHAGHLKAARKLLASLCALRGSPGPLDVRAVPLGARITADASILERPSDSAVPPPTDGPILSWVTGGLLWAAELAAIHRDRRAASACLEQLPRWKGTFLDRSTDALLGELCCAVDKLDEAVGHFEDALAFCRRAGYRPELAWSCAYYAGTLLRRNSPGDLERAKKLLGEGLAISRTLGMTPLAKRILASQEALDGPSHRRRAHPDGLTHREVEVLELLARGLTNAEVADRLRVSPLTAARHVHNLLDKTGMSNRAEATAWAARNGLLGNRL